MWLFWTSRTNLFDGASKHVLHIAPEACFERRLRRALGAGYLTGDLMDPNVDRKVDVTALPFENASFDVVLCSHVLEHVPDDRLAMREFRRVLRPAGWAMPLVPVTAPQTVEDPSVTDPAEQLRLFGQDDHVRRYGPDYADRLREAGFHVQEVRPADLAPPERVAKLRLTEAAGIIHFCTPA